MLDEAKVQDIYEGIILRYALYAAERRNSRESEAIFWEIVSHAECIGKILGYTEAQVTADMRKQLIDMYGEEAVRHER